MKIAICVPHLSSRYFQTCRCNLCDTEQINEVLVVAKPEIELCDVGIVVEVSFTGIAMTNEPGVIETTDRVTTTTWICDYWW